MKVGSSAVGIVVCALLLGGCGPKRPVLYPNDLYEEMGRDAAEEDVNHCIELAENNNLPTDKQPESAAKGAVRGGAIGAAIGAAVGAVFGRAGRGAGAGAAGGGVRGGIGGYEGSGDGDSVYRRFIETCLREKGYQPIGWK